MQWYLVNVQVSENPIDFRTFRHLQGAPRALASRGTRPFSLVRGSPPLSLSVCLIWTYNTGAVLFACFSDFTYCVISIRHTWRLLQDEDSTPWAQSGHHLMGCCMVFAFWLSWIILLWTFRGSFLWTSISASPRCVWNTALLCACVVGVMLSCAVSWFNIWRIARLFSWGGTLLSYPPGVCVQNLSLHSGRQLLWFNVLLNVVVLVGETYYVAVSWMWFPRD